MLISRALMHLHIIFLVTIEAAERCLIKDENGDRMFVLCPDYCCGNRTLQYCCNNCWASANGIVWCSQTAIVSGLILLFVGVLLVLLLVSASAQFDKITSWTGQCFASPRCRVAAGMAENESGVASTGTRNMGAATGNPTDAAGSLSLNLVPAFLLPKLPTYSECTPSDPPPPFQLVSNLQPPNSEQDRSHRSRVVPEPRTPRITRLETPPPNYESVNHSKLARKGQD